MSIRTDQSVTKQQVTLSNFTSKNPAWKVQLIGVKHMECQQEVPIHKLVNTNGSKFDSIFLTEQMQW